MSAFVEPHHAKLIKTMPPPAMVIAPTPRKTLPSQGPRTVFRKRSSNCLWNRSPEDGVLRWQSMRRAIEGDGLLGAGEAFEHLEAT